jgi:hypothetical protein
MQRILMAGVGADRQACDHSWISAGPETHIQQARTKLSAGPGVTVVCVFITAVPVTKLFAWGEGDSVGDMCYERRRAEEACLD